MMQRIYQNATLVLSWLGVMRDKTLVGIEAMELIADKIASNPECTTNFNWMQNIPSSGKGIVQVKSKLSHGSR
jgi:hypothetical protein